MVSRELIKRGYDEFGGPDDDFLSDEQNEEAAETRYYSRYSRMPRQQRRDRDAETTESRLREPNEPESRLGRNQPNENEQEWRRQQRRRAAKAATRRARAEDVASVQPLSHLAFAQRSLCAVSGCGGQLKRFGSDTFRYGTGNAEELPIDLPAGPDYVLGPGDSLVSICGERFPAPEPTCRSPRSSGSS